MAFLKFAKAIVEESNVGKDKWNQIRQASSTDPFNKTGSSINLGEYADPSKYLLTHCTIIASVDVDEVPNVKIGEKIQGDGGQSIKRLHNDYYITPETSKFVNCFESGTHITMGDGTVKNIEDVRVGDEVRTHKGRIRKVTQTFENDYEGNILDIKIQGSNERLSTTPEHPFFVFEANKECVECGSDIDRNNKSASHLLGRHYCSKWCYYEKGASNKSLLKEKDGTFLEAEDLTPKQHFATQPIIPIDVYNTGITKGQARLIGYFLAEGHYELDSYNDNSKVGVLWAFHENERHTLAQNVVELMESEFGVQCVVRDSSDHKGIYVTTRTNRDMVSFFQKWVKGNESVTKYLHPYLLQESSEILFEILRGWFEGDGSFFVPTGEKAPRLEGTSASASLINQVHQILNSLGISSRRSHRERPGRIKDPVTGSVINDLSTTLECWEVLVGYCWVSELIKDTIYEDLFDVKVQTAPSHRFINDYCVQMITEVEARPENTKVYNIEVEEDHSYLANGFAVHNCNGDAWERELLMGTYRTFIGAENYVEHIQIPDLSKGKVIDAVSRDLGDTVYVDILVATNRKHGELVADIEAGKINTLSMGCSIQYSICTKCGNVAADETELCEHVKYEKGNYFHDAKGKKRVIAELCGYKTDPESVTFIEASWVANPAFKGAVLRSILNSSSDITPEEREATAEKQAELLTASPMLAEFLESQNIDKHVRTAAQEILGQELESVRILKEELNSRLASVSKKSFGFDDEEEEDEEGGDEGSPIEEIRNDIKKELHNDIKKEITEDMKNELGLDPREVLFEDKGDSGKPNVNDNIISGFQAFSSRYSSEIKNSTRLRKVFSVIYEAKEGGWDKVARMNQVSNRDIVAAMYLKDRDYGSSPLPSELYTCLSKVGGSSNYNNVHSFLNACHLALGRKTSVGESKVLIRRSKLLK